MTLTYFVLGKTDWLAKGLWFAQVVGKVTLVWNDGLLVQCTLVVDKTFLAWNGKLLVGAWCWGSGFGLTYRSMT